MEGIWHIPPRLPWLKNKDALILPSIHRTVPHNKELSGQKYQCQSWETVPYIESSNCLCKDWIVNIFLFVSHAVSITTACLCLCRMKAATDNIPADSGCICFTITFIYKDSQPAWCWPGLSFVDSSITVILNLRCSLEELKELLNMVLPGLPFPQFWFDWSGRPPVLVLVKNIPWMKMYSQCWQPSPEIVAVFVFESWTQPRRPLSAVSRAFSCNLAFVRDSPESPQINGFY